MVAFYYGMKVFLFASFVRSLVRFEALERYTLFLSILYTTLVGLLSYVFLVAAEATPNYELWQYWLGMNFLLTLVYFKLLVRFSEGVWFWVVLPLGMVVLFNEPNLVPYWLNLVR